MSSPIAEIQLTAVAPISEAVSIIEKYRYKIALVVGDGGVLVGTITDGDVRRGLLKGYALEAPVAAIMNSRPVTLAVTKRGAAREVMARWQVMQVPLVDADGRVVGMEYASTAASEPTACMLGNTVVIMAGGEGKRLRPFTEVMPKPMLKVGGKPMLETIIENFSRAGLRDFVLSVNYRADVIKSHFGDGSNHGVSIRYLEEPRPMGTAGALRLLDPAPSQAIIVVNGDVLTNLDYQNLLQFHEENRALITVALQRYRHTVPFGVVEVQDELIASIREKPTLEYFVNAGIYVVEPAAIMAIPGGQSFDMPSLIQLALSHRERVAAFPIMEYWIDVGHAADLTRATLEYDEAFSR